MYRNNDQGNFRKGNTFCLGRSGKRGVAILLSVMLTVGMSLTAYAEEEGQTSVETQQAEQAEITTEEPVSEEKEESTVVADEEMAKETNREDVVDAAITGETASVKENTESEEGISSDEATEVSNADDTHEEDVSDGMVFTLSCCSKVSNMCKPLCHTESCSFCQVIIFLLVYLNKTISKGSHSLYDRKKLMNGRRLPGP